MPENPPDWTGYKSVGSALAAGALFRASCNRDPRWSRPFGWRLQMFAAAEACTAVLAVDRPFSGNSGVRAGQSVHRGRSLQPF